MIARFFEAWDNWYFTLEDRIWERITWALERYWDWILLGGYRRWIALIVFCSLIISIKWLFEKWGKILRRWK